MAMLQHPEVGESLVAFLVELEKNPRSVDRKLWFDNGVRRIEATPFGTICIGYDLVHRIPAVYLSLVPYHPREIYVWGIAPRDAFARRMNRGIRKRAAAVLEWLREPSW